MLANPPYIRQELLGRDYKEKSLKPNFAEVYSGTADIYVYFFARANAMLKENGVGCFISSNKWLRAGYGEKLRQHLLDDKKFHLVVDFGELPVFKAATFPAIFLWQNDEREETPTNWAVVKDLASLLYRRCARTYCKFERNFAAVAIRNWQISTCFCSLNKFARNNGKKRRSIKRICQRRNLLWN